MTSPPSLLKKISRRGLLKAAGGNLALGFLPSFAKAADQGLLSSEKGLKVLAKKGGKLFGSAIHSSQFTNPYLVHALLHETDLIVPEGELKWLEIHPTPSHYNFSGYKKLAAFAQTFNLEMRGHTLLWHHANPSWLEPALQNTKSPEKILHRYFDKVLLETASVIHEWDVVNEIITPLSSREDGLRETLWLKAMGPSYISEAFHKAHAINPKLKLVLNDFGFERGGENGAFRRRNMLSLLENLKKNYVPVHVLGIQGHLECHRPMGGANFVRFLQRVKEMGIEIKITELDVDASQLNGNTTDKIEGAASYLRTFLDMLHDAGDINTIITWGLTDSTSWLRDNTPDIAGALPLDKDMRRSPVWYCLRDYFET